MSTWVRQYTLTLGIGITVLVCSLVGLHEALGLVPSTLFASLRLWTLVSWVLVEEPPQGVFQLILFLFLAPILENRSRRQMIFLIGFVSSTTAVSMFVLMVSIYASSAFEPAM